jgi:DNA mismatch repair ATPase MutS
VHQFILSEFKEKYDQLKGQFEAKKKEADGLLYDKKKLEIELLNHNVEYYEKEIIRLRGEVEKYQLENEENKHRFFIAENSRKDLEATSKVRQDELKLTLKQL